MTPPPPPPPKKTPSRGKETEKKPKKPVKRLEEPVSTKKAASKRTRGSGAVVESTTVRQLRPRAQHSDHEISSSTKLYEGGEGSISTSGREGESATVNGTSGWFSRCVIT